MADDCTATSPLGKPTILFYQFTGTNYTFTLRAGQGPRTGYRLEYGQNCGDFTNNIDITNADATTYTISNFATPGAFCARLQEVNGCAAGEWSNNFDHTDSSTASATATTSATTATDSAKSSNDLPVSGAIETTLILLAMGALLVAANFIWRAKKNDLPF